MLTIWTFHLTKLKLPIEQLPKASFKHSSFHVTPLPTPSSVFLLLSEWNQNSLPWLLRSHMIWFLTLSDLISFHRLCALHCCTAADRASALGVPSAYDVLSQLCTWLASRHSSLGSKVTSSGWPSLTANLKYLLSCQCITFKYFS